MRSRKYERINKIRRTLVFAPLPTRPSQLEKCAALSVVFYQTAAGMPRAAFVIVPGCCLEVAGARRSRSWATATLSTRRGSAQLREALALLRSESFVSCFEPMLWATATLPTGRGSVQLRAALAQWIPFFSLEPMHWATANKNVACCAYLSIAFPDICLNILANSPYYQSCTSNGTFLLYNRAKLNT